MDRLKRYHAVSQKLKSFSNSEIQNLISTSIPLHVGIDGKTFELTLDFQKIFVKKLPLSALEILSENWMSPNNIFQLPLFCQYGLGAPGFGSWRELLSNQKSTQWVLEGVCENFTLLYHWCLLPVEQSGEFTVEEQEEIEKDVGFWENSDELRERYKAIRRPITEVILFSEFVPINLKDWIKSQSAQISLFEKALDFVDQKILTTIEFMQSRNFIHFDAHFENIMTDGKTLYFSDLGLALDGRFLKQTEEIEFFNQHRNYDYARTAVGFVHALITAVYGNENWRINFFEQLKLIAENSAAFKGSETVHFYLKKYGPLAAEMLNFSDQLKSNSKRTPFPNEQMERLVQQLYQP